MDVGSHPLPQKIIAKDVSNKKWFEGLDTIRFILAFIVVLGHYENPWVDFFRSSNQQFFRYIGQALSISFSGVAAVICFFIISGFVIHYPNRNGIKNIRNFYIRRSIRVLVPLIFISAISIPFGNPESAVVWSLYCELIYYALYPLLCRVTWSWQTKLYLSYLFCFLAIMIGAYNDILSLYYGGDHGYNGQFWQLGTGFTWLIGLPSWLLGVLLADKVDANKIYVSRLKIYVWRFFVFAISIAVLVMRFHFFVSYIISLSILSFLFYKWLEYEIHFFKENKAFKHLENCGKFSYSLYLTHPLFFILLSGFIPLTTSTYFLYLFLAILLSYVFYLLLEKPAHLLAQRFGKRYALK
jgi:peptidoglycan/LPS O-acetylase OafA/YrhL